MTAVIHKTSVGAGGKHTLSPEESLRQSSSSSSSKILFQQDSCIYKVIVGLHTGPA